MDKRVAKISGGYELGHQNWTTHLLNSYDTQVRGLYFRIINVP